MPHGKICYLEIPANRAEDSGVLLRMGSLAPMVAAALFCWPCASAVAQRKEPSAAERAAIVNKYPCRTVRFPVTAVQHLDAPLNCSFGELVHSAVAHGLANARGVSPADTGAIRSGSVRYWSFVGFGGAAGETYWTVEVKLARRSRSLEFYVSPSGDVVRVVEGGEFEPGVDY